MKTFAKLALFVLCLGLLLSCNQNTTSPKAQAIALRPQLEMTTNYGNLTLELYNETPLHRDNFLNLAKNGAFDGLLFHRVIENFMIQGGDPDSKLAEAGIQLGEGDAPYTVAAEMHPELFHKKGALAAARDNNPTKASSAMQFYIVQGGVQTDSLLTAAERYTSQNMARDFFANRSEKQQLINAIDTALYSGQRDQYRTLMDSILSLALTQNDFTPYTMPEAYKEVYKSVGGYPRLDQNYTVFGEVISGLAIIDSIAKQNTDNNNRPLQDVLIESVKLVN